MNCINTICLYLKKYLTDEQFENIFYDYIEDFQNSLEEDMYLNVLSTNFSSKQEKISLETELYNYVLENYDSVYENINDAYVEPAHGVLGADVPVHPLPAALLYLGLQLRHQPLAAVAAAHGIGAAAGKAQVPDALSVHIGRNALFQQGNVLPVGGAAAVDIAVFVGGRVQRDLMPGGSSLCEQGQIHCYSTII